MICATEGCNTEILRERSSLGIMVEYHLCEPCLVDLREASDQDDDSEYGTWVDDQVEAAKSREVEKQARLAKPAKRTK